MNQSTFAQAFMSLVQKIRGTAHLLPIIPEMQKGTVTVGEIYRGDADPKTPVVSLQNFQQFRYDFPVFRRRKAAQKGRSGNDH